jgi:hypothetical protein
VFAVLSSIYSKVIQVLSFCIRFAFSSFPYLLLHALPIVLIDVECKCSISLSFVYGEDECGVKSSNFMRPKIQSRKGQVFSIT